MAIFISYSSADEKYAEQLNQILIMNHYDTWFAPKNIGGSESFSEKIGKELTIHKSVDEAERILEDANQLSVSCFFILLLSASSMESKWVAKEVTTAMNGNIPMLVLKIDRSLITPNFEFLLSDCQYIEAYRFNSAVKQMILEKLEEKLPQTRENAQSKLKKNRFTYEEIGIESVASGDPYFTEGETLKITLGNGQFFLSPPAERLAEEEVQAYLKDHEFKASDIVFDTALKDFCAQIEIDNLYEMIEESRRNIFAQFLHQENGCYFNNHKYGISRISRFERTETMAELPVLRIEMFETDYFTHRVMKDVCKKLAKTNKKFIRSLNFNRISEMKILFTSLGVNLILSDDKGNILLTSRSINAAETYKRHNFSLSAIEGVSISDYDTFNRTVNVRYTALRGLQEELGVDESYLKQDSLRFYDLFVNPANLEMGLSCSIELKKEYQMEQDIIPLHGKDEQLEVSTKFIVRSGNLEQFIYNNRAALLAQSLYTLCVYMESQGVFMLNRTRRSLIKDMISVIAKNGKRDACGDMYVWGDHYIAVIDGATPKGKMLWEGQKGDVYVSHLVADAIVNMDPDLSAEEAISHINQVIRNEYTKRNIDIKTLRPEERLQCSLLLYSVNKHEIWSFGDCMLRINSREFVHTKEGDQLLAALRAFCIQIERDRRGNTVTEQELSDFGRQMILPYLKEYISLANRNVPFGYDVLDGGNIIPAHVKIYSVQKDDTVVMASDGYPKLFDTFEETEEYLKKALELDPTCIDLLRGTKGIDAGNESYDDRTYVSFVVV